MYLKRSATFTTCHIPCRRGKTRLTTTRT